MSLSEEQHAWLVGTLKINVKHADVETGDGGEQGFKPRARGAEYEGEEAQVGAWRSAKKRDDESQEAYERRIARGHFVTRSFNEEERAEARTSTDEEGRLRDAEGNLLSQKKMYTMDARTGELNVGDEGYGIRDLDAEGNPDGDLRDGFGGFQSDIRDAALSGGQQRVETTHHSTLAVGGEVASAGFIETEDGKVRKITNSSGHYKPQFEHLLQAVEHLMKTGAMLDTEIVDHEGNSVKDSNPKAFAVYTKVQTLIKSLDADKQSIQAALAGLTEEAIGEDEAAALDRKIKAHAARTETAQKALAALRKMGIGPRNAMTGKVELTYASAAATGHDFRASAQTETMEAHEFLMGQGAQNLVGEEDAGGLGLDLEELTYPEDEDEDSGGLLSGAQPYATSEMPTPPDSPAEPAAAKPWRDFDKKEDMLDELREVARERKLRPEDRGEEGRAAISEGEAPALDEAAWGREIDELADALSETETDMGLSASEQGSENAQDPLDMEMVYVDELGEEIESQLNGLTGDADEDEREPLEMVYVDSEGRELDPNTGLPITETDDSAVNYVNEEGDQKEQSGLGYVEDLDDDTKDEKHVNRR